MNLYKHAKNQAILPIYSGHMVDQEILQSDWLSTLWPISQEQKFSQIWDLGRNTSNKISFHYRTNSLRINEQINKFKKLCFWPILGQNKIFQNIWPCHAHNFIWTSSTMPKFRNKIMIQFQENVSTGRQTEGQILLHRTLPATARGVQKVISKGFYNSKNSCKPLR